MPGSRQSKDCGPGLFLHAISHSNRKDVSTALLHSAHRTNNPVAQSHIAQCCNLLTERTHLGGGTVKMDVSERGACLTPREGSFSRAAFILALTVE
eukprot:1160256-Pelagomonas_calceolata.AAC.29